MVQCVPSSILNLKQSRKPRFIETATLLLFKAHTKAALKVSRFHGNLQQLSYVMFIACYRNCLKNQCHPRPKVRSTCILHIIPIIISFLEHGITGMATLPGKSRLASTSTTAASTFPRVAITVIKEGHLYKRPRGRNATNLRGLKFQKRYCVLSSHSLEYYESKKVTIDNYVYML